jgi:hypothetical protein
MISLAVVECNFYHKVHINKIRKNMAMMITNQK